MTLNDLVRRSTQTLTINSHNDSNWKTVFKFPFIAQVAAANKLKIYQAAFTVLVVPLSFMLESMEILPITTCYVTSAIGKITNIFK